MMIGVGRGREGSDLGSMVFRGFIHNLHSVYKYVHSFTPLPSSSRALPLRLRLSRPRDGAHAGLQGGGVRGDGSRPGAPRERRRVAAKDADAGEERVTMTAEE